MTHKSPRTYGPSWPREIIGVLFIVPFVLTLVVGVVAYLFGDFSWMRIVGSFVCYMVSFWLYLKEQFTSESRMESVILFILSTVLAGFGAWYAISGNFSNPMMY